jgi:hypothetical protein
VTFCIASATFFIAHVTFLIASVTFSVASVVFPVVLYGVAFCVVLFTFFAVNAVEASGRVFKGLLATVAIALFKGFTALFKGFTALFEGFTALFEGFTALFEGFTDGHAHLRGCTEGRGKQERKRGGKAALGLL